MTVLSIPTRAPAQVATHQRVLVRPTTELARMTRYRGGTYSHTVDRVVFSDGTSARTDLIRLHPNVHAYSLDFAGIAPNVPSRYRVGTWSALPHLHGRDSEAEVEVDWILRNSFPLNTTAELSRRVRDAGHPLGAANINEHEAIAATQAAIWYLTNGLALDTQPLNIPVAVRRGPGPVVTFEFDGQPQLGGYSVRACSETPVTVRLQKSANGVDWQDVSGSRLTAQAGKGSCRRALGVGSTLSASGHGQRGSGYRYYRLIAAGATETSRIGHVGFWLTGSRHYRNADRVVHLYNYLLAGALSVQCETDEFGLVDGRATTGPELVGPFQVRIPLAINAADGHALVDSDGFAIEGIVQPGTDFYIRPTAGSSATTLTATPQHNLTGRVLTGVALDGAPQRFTPVALAVTTDVAIHFDIRWDGDCPPTSLEKADGHR